MENLKELDFIYENFFFKGINPHIFEKNYFHLFSPREYYRGSILFSNGTIPRCLILLKSGRISLELKASVIDIHNLIQFIFNNMLTNPIFSKLTQANKNKFLSNHKISIIKNYINDPILTRLKMHNNRFIEEMNVVRTCQIKNLTNNEAIGLEEIFLRLPYLMKASVISEKIHCYEISLEHLNKMLNNNKKEMINVYIKFSINKIISFIERLQDIKQNSISMSLIKFEKEMLKSKGWLHIGKDSKNKYDENRKKEGKLSKTRNQKFNKLLKKNSEKDINNDNNENKFEYSTIINQNNSSPVKLVVTNISPKSQYMFEKLIKTYKKIQKRQEKYKNRQFNMTKNNSANIIPSLDKTIKNNYSYNIKEPFFKTVAINKIFSYDSKIKEDLQTTYANNQISGTKNEKMFKDHSEEKNQTEKNISDSEASINKKYKDEISSNNLSKNSPKIKNRDFNLSYIPLDLICQNESFIHKNKPFISYLIKENKKPIDLSILKKNYSTIIDNNSNNNDNLNSSCNNTSIIKSNYNYSKELKNRLNVISKRDRFINHRIERNIEKSVNSLNKKVLISGIVKDFYKGIRLNGYSSFIHNKDKNTLFMRKYNKKYDSAERAQYNIKNHLLKSKDSLPFILSN